MEEKQEGRSRRRATVKVGTMRMKPWKVSHFDRHIFLQTGGDYDMAESFDIEVVSIDLSINMISLAIEHAIGFTCSVEFECADCTKKTHHPENSFEVISYPYEEYGDNLVGVTKWRWKTTDAIPRSNTDVQDLSSWTYNKQYSSNDIIDTL